MEGGGERTCCGGADGVVLAMVKRAAERARTVGRRRGSIITVGRGRKGAGAFRVLFGDDWISSTRGVAS